MAVPVVATKQLSVAANAAIIAALQAVVSGTPFALVGGGTVTLDTQRRVLLTFGNEASNRTVLLTGTNDSGTVITETLTVPSGAGGTVASLQDFKTITRALPGGGGWTTTASLGTNSTGSTPWFIPDTHITPFELFIGTELLSGAATWSIEYTPDSPWPALPPYVAGFSQALPIPRARGWAGLIGLANDADGAIDSPVAAWRLTITAGAGQVQATGRQAGISN